MVEKEKYNEILADIDTAIKTVSESTESEVSDAQKIALGRACLESLESLLIKDFNIRLTGNEDLFKKTQILSKTVLSWEETDTFHDLRRLGNAGAHENVKKEITKEQYIKTAINLKNYVIDFRDNHDERVKKIKPYDKNHYEKALRLISKCLNQMWYGSLKQNSDKIAFKQNLFKSLIYFENDFCSIYGIAIHSYFEETPVYLQSMEKAIISSNQISESATVRCTFNGTENVNKDINILETLKKIRTLTVGALQNEANFTYEHTLNAEYLYAIIAYYKKKCDGVAKFIVPDVVKKKCNEVSQQDQSIEKSAELADGERTNTLQLNARFTSHALTDRKRKKQRKMMIIIGLAAVLLVCGCSVGVTAYFMNKSFEKKLALATASKADDNKTEAENEAPNASDSTSDNAVSSQSTASPQAEENRYPATLSEIADDETLEAMKQQAIDAVKTYYLNDNYGDPSNFEYAGMILKKKKEGVSTSKAEVTNSLELVISLDREYVSEKIYAYVDYDNVKIDSAGKLLNVNAMDYDLHHENNGSGYRFADFVNAVEKDAEFYTFDYSSELQ